MIWNSKPSFVARILFAALALGVLCTGPLWALGRTREGRRGKILAAAEVYLPGNGGDGFIDDVEEVSTLLAAGGYSSVWSVTTKAAVGGRIGYLFAINENFLVGPSFGYIVGPDASANLTLAGGGLTATLTADRDVGFFRTLLEEQAMIPVGEKMFLNLGAGIGFAAGNVRETLHCTGTACTVSGSTEKANADWTGFTWEISPGFSYGDFFVAYRYAGFPSFGGDDSLSPIHWRTSVFVAGWTF